LFDEIDAIVNANPNVIFIRPVYACDNSGVKKVSGKYANGKNIYVVSDYVKIKSISLITETIP
jgi:hypothetical protein